MISVSDKIVRSEHWYELSRMVRKTGAPRKYSQVVFSDKMGNIDAIVRNVKFGIMFETRATVN